MLKRLGVISAVLALLAAGYAALLWWGLLGTRLESPRPNPAQVPADWLQERELALEDAAAEVGETQPTQILFGDLHVHTTYSGDAFLWSLPLMQGEGAHPPADACDFARFCSGLDFWALTDHAESLSEDRWQASAAAIRNCQALSGPAEAPDLVSFLGWEWTQVGLTPESHYGHRNVVLRHIEASKVPAGPVAATGPSLDVFQSTDLGLLRLLLPLLDFPNRQSYYDLDVYLRETAGIRLCTPGEGAEDGCLVTAATPRELFERLDAWNLEALAIPHGTAWGATTPPGASWDAQLEAGQHDPRRQPLLEIHSGHGNSEEFRPWRAVKVGPAGEALCPEPRDSYLPACWRAGEIIAERCLAAGEAPEECEARALRARRLHAAAGVNGVRVVPGQRQEDWLDAGQCRDCFLPAFDYRPGMSAQYALALGAAGEGTAGRFRFGLVGSSDNHSARPGTGYKEFSRLAMSDQRGIADEGWLRWLPAGAPPDAAPLEVGALEPRGLEGAERMASFWLSGGLVAAHSRGRSRDALWEALQRRQVYATSGPRILLWFDWLNASSDGGASTPMGGEARTRSAPRFRVRALGARVQQPGCADEAREILGDARLALLCKDECHHPGDTRERIARIEVVRIRPRQHAGERIEHLVEDPWRVFDCGPEAGACVVDFEDPEFPEAARDAVYYVRAVQEASLAINAGTLRCRAGDQRACQEVAPCYGDFRSDEADDCLAPAEERAWSSPIFVDYGAPS